MSNTTLTPEKDLTLALDALLLEVDESIVADLRKKIIADRRQEYNRGKSDAQEWITDDQIIEKARKDELLYLEPGFINGAKWMREQLKPSPPKEQ